MNWTCFWNVIPKTPPPTMLWVKHCEISRKEHWCDVSRLCEVGPACCHQGVCCYFMQMRGQLALRHMFVCVCVFVLEQWLLFFHGGILPFLLVAFMLFFHYGWATFCSFISSWCDRWCVRLPWSELSLEWKYWKGFQLVWWKVIQLSGQSEQYARTMHSAYNVLALC